MRQVESGREILSPDAEYEELRSRLARAVGRACPSWLRDRSDDLIQVALVKVFEIRQRSVPERELSSAYLTKVAHSALVDEIRRLRRRREVPLEDESVGEVPASAAPSPERDASGREIAGGLRDCLGRMRQARRQAVTLSLLGHSVPDAARLLGWGSKRTENLVYRGLSDLRKCLAAKGLSP